MPRPRVRPEARRRALQACISCQRSKIRCNSGVPCSTCVRRNRTSSCRYSNDDKTESYGPQQSTASPIPTPDVSQHEHPSPSLTYPFATVAVVTPSPSNIHGKFGRARDDLLHVEVLESGKQPCIVSNSYWCAEIFRSWWTT